MAKSFLSMLVFLRNDSLRRVSAERDRETSGKLAELTSQSAESCLYSPTLHNK
jgi:hypothetical protein